MRYSRLFLSVCSLVIAVTALAADETTPSYLRDRGPGVPTSMFGTYITKGWLTVYPFFEYYRDNNAEYQPDEFGFGSDQELRGSFSASEAILFVGYGLSDRIALEFEAAMISAELDRAPNDPTAMPEEIEESGLGDVQTQVNWLWSPETAGRPGYFSYAEVVYPLNKGRDLIGTTDWEFKVGTGLVRGFGWGTMTVRMTAEYTRVDRKLDFGEMAIEYLKRVSPSWRLYAGVEGTQDEVTLITEAQWHLSSNVFLKLNNGIGITSKATDWAPEIGFVFGFPTLR